jgi:hypothetical protein
MSAVRAGVHLGSLSAADDDPGVWAEVLDLDLDQFLHGAEDMQAFPTHPVVVGSIRLVPIMDVAMLVGLTAWSPVNVAHQSPLS